MSEPPRNPRGAAPPLLTRRAALGGLTALGLGSLGTGALTSCAPSNADELAFWNFIGPGGTSQEQSDWIQRLAAAWNADHRPKVRLRYVPNADYLNGPTLQTAFSANHGPDVFMLSPGDFLRYHNAGVLADLTPYLNATVRADYLPGALDSRTFEGRVYGLPMESEPLALFYSTEAFERAGLSAADVPRTWDQLLDVADKLTTARRFGLVVETNPGYYQNFTWYPFMWMGGGSPLAADQRRSTFDSKATVAALRLWQEAINRGLAPGRPQGSGGNDSISNLAAGYCAMQQVGIWAIGEIAELAPDFRYGVAPLPVPEGGEELTCAGGWALCANAKGRDPDAAARFVAWALGGSDAACIERSRQWNTKVKMTIPVRDSVRRAAQRQGDFENPAYRLFVDRIAPKAVGEPRYPVEIYRTISDTLQACQLDNADPAASAAQATEAIDTFLSTYDGAPIQ
ncbi:carbohydrate ABC transporter substrate-binding protein (CUT1 family) [Tamaricihabitans halophyticus]|uniref:Carbohydrate ABC transporter substrate-binding protein (CUT1 family) n=1 Tax=Tamaricihabitans halophyticus TaxID=1262583 RepID=A0A4R2Q9G1_9PSEU|nr:sugar ABC transporter substrate-binding protein [Tamaricihabitans halophyticus]TCP44764.1 carbohydrate ABC transporter substrate-binding protein (CUT1 family) [Tamaricihabitans halophyticus]